MDELEKLAKQFQDDRTQNEASFHDEIQKLKRDIETTEMTYRTYPPLSTGQSIDSMVMSGSAVYSTENRIIEGGIRLAAANQLTIMQKLNIESFNVIGEEIYKTMVKRDMSLKIASDITAKTKFTMLKEPNEVTVKAKVYVFNEVEMIAFIEKIVQIAK